MKGDTFPRIFLVCCFACRFGRVEMIAVRWVVPSINGDCAQLVFWSVKGDTFSGVAEAVSRLAATGKCEEVVITILLRYQSCLASASHLLQSCSSG